MIFINARQAALIALERCRREGAWSGRVMDEIISKNALEKRDAALASKLCLGVIQNISLCEFYIDFYSSVKCNKLEPKVKDILMMGVYQLIFLDIPARAAVNESVVLCKKCGYERAAGLVNAVLRRIAENAAQLPDIPNVGSAEHLSIKYSHSQWLAEKLVTENGYEHTEAFFSCNNNSAALTIQVNTLKISVSEYKTLLSEAGINFKEHSYLDGCIILNGGNVNALPGFADGYFYVQDAAARTAVEIAGVKSGMRILDACSAPGGKSFASAIKMGNSGSILSCDIHEKKLGLVRNSAERLGINIMSTSAADARKNNDRFNGAFDLVIADVPCSGIGVIGKKPEIRWKKESDIASLPDIQLDILHNLSSYVRCGGTLLYSTCTVLTEENENVVRSFLMEKNNFIAEPFEIGNIRAENGMYCFWPHIDGCDGFFAAKLKRIG